MDKTIHKNSTRKIKGKFLNRVYEWGKDLIIAAFIALFIITFLFQNTKVQGLSMEPTLQDGNAIIINKFIYHFRSPRRGEIVAFHYHKDPSQNFIKRVIGLPGEEIDIKDGTVYINEQPIEEAYICEPMDQKIKGDLQFPFVVPEHTYFVMGDNRNISLDSRYEDVGPIDKSSIIGSAVLRIWPTNELGVLY